MKIDVHGPQTDTYDPEHVGLTIVATGTALPEDASDVELPMALLGVRINAAGILARIAVELARPMAIMQKAHDYDLKPVSMSENRALTRDAVEKYADGLRATFEGDTIRRNRGMFDSGRCGMSARIEPTMEWEDPIELSMSVPKGHYTWWRDRVRELVRKIQKEGLPQ